MIEGEWNIENAVELTEEAEKVLVYNNFIYHHNLDTKGGFNKLNPCCFVTYMKHSLEMVFSTFE
jgi:hypothetical protein